MKYIQTFESYLSYNDLNYKHPTGQSTESMVENDLRIKITNLLRYGGISDHLDDVKFEDQSSDKGIKWEITLKGKGTDVIHAYKTSRWQGNFEFYLNKKKSDEVGIQEYFLDKYLTDLDKYVASMKSYDVNYFYSDDSRVIRSGDSHGQTLKELYSKLSNADKKKAMAEYEKIHNRKVDPSSFVGF